MLNSVNAGKLVESAWEKVMENVEHGSVNLINVKSLMLMFALEFKKFCGVNDELCYDMEYRVYEKSKEKNRMVDLIIYDKNKQKFKLAFKFQVIKMTDKNKSKQKQKLVKTYRDIARLQYLVQNDINSIKEAYFLCSVNHNDLINKNKIKKGHYKIHEAYTYNAKSYHSKIGKLLFPKTFTFTWKGIRTDKIRNIIIGKYAWLKPIRIIVDLEEKKKKEMKKKEKEEKFKKKENRQHP